VVIGLWAIFWPEPYLACMSAAVLAPVVAVAIAGFSDGQIDLGEEEGSFARPSVHRLAVMPTLGLALRSLLDYAQIDWLPTIGAAAVLTPPLTFVVARAGFKDRPYGLTGVIGLAVFTYVWGALVQLNALAGDHSTEFALTKVVSMRETSGRDASNYLTLAPPRYPGVPDEVDVGRRLYDATKVGDEVCIHVHRGVLTWRWYEVDFCPT